MKILKFTESLNESSYISFSYKGNDINIKGDTPTDVYISLMEWLYNNDYKFIGPAHNTKTRKIYSIEDIEKNSWNISKFHNIGNSGRFIPKSSLFLGGNVELKLSNMLKMLESFGINMSTVKSLGFEGKRRSETNIDQTEEIDVDDFETELEPTKKCYVVRAGQGNRDVNIFLDESYVGIGYNTKDFDISKKTKEEIDSFLTNISIGNRNQINQYLSQIELFKKIKINDVVLLPDTNSVHVGTVTSDVYLADDDSYFNRIDVEWFDEIEKNRIVNQPKTVFQIYNFDFENLDFKSDEENKKMTFIEAAQLILKENDNQPMSAREIWDQIEEQELVQTSGSTPWATLNASMLTYADNSRSRTQRKIKLFHIVSDNPVMFILINPEQEVQSDIEDDFSDLDEVKPFGKFPQPFDVESELKRAQAQSEEDVLSFKNFRATEPNESPDELMIFNSYVKNTFSQAICVLGKSGAGKSTTIDNILKKSGHVYQYIIPSASTTGLLSQFSPSAGSAGGYIPSRLGQMIEMAYKNKDKNYTAVFDECHKTSIIEMINDELLQAISKNRNKGVRFISLDDDTRRLYPSAQEDNRGNVLIPDNFGFIFISSNARVISGNPDFFNRVDLIELTIEDRQLKTVEELNQKRVTSEQDKKELVNKIVSGGE
jgi:hypothetical protein